MKVSIIFSIALLLIIIFLICNFKEGFKSKRNLDEGTLSYHKRMVVKHVHRPLKLKARDMFKKLKAKLIKFKRNYL